MSRAPPPIKNDTVTALNTDAGMNPYSMQTYSMAPGPMNYPTGAQQHPLQTMWSATNSHTPSNYNGSPQCHPHSHAHHSRGQGHHGHPGHAGMAGGMYGGHTVNSNMGPYAPNTQNVNVVDFKPDVMAQHNMAQTQNNYQQNANYMGHTQSPASIGLLDSYGCYIPATAADAPHYEARSGAHIGPDHPYNNPRSHMRNSGHDSRPFHPGYDKRGRPHGYDEHGHPLGCDYDGYQSNGYSNGNGSHAKRDQDTSHTNSHPFNDVINERMGSRASAVSAAKAASTASSRALSDMIDDRVAVSHKAAASAAAAKEVASKVPKVATSTKTTPTEQTMTKADMDSVIKSIEAKDARTSTREMKSMIDQRFHQLNSANAAKTAAAAATDSRATKSMIDERFHQLNSANTAKTSASAHADSRAAAYTNSRASAYTDRNTTASFNEKSKKEQRELVGEAIRRVTEHVTEHGDEGSGPGRRYTRSDSY
jgi:hypothetical protein